MITYRSFSNWDPPGLSGVWNSIPWPRGAARDIGPGDLERLVLSRPYFDPEGLVVAESGGTIVGFAHAGFGPDQTQSALCRQSGVITMLAVNPDYQGQGIGRKLAQLAEQYLRNAGSEVLYAGAIHPLDPFYLGLYGGSELPGILRSHTSAHELFQSLRYQPVDECIVYRAHVPHAPVVLDARARRWLRRIRLQIDSEPVQDNWWDTCRYSGLEALGFHLVMDNQIVARASGWLMFPTARNWGREGAAICGVQVVPQFRNQGLGILLLTHIMRHYYDSRVLDVEIQTMARNSVAQKLYTGLGFHEVDRGLVYRAPGQS